MSVRHPRSMSSPRGGSSPRDNRGKRDNGKPEMLLGKNIVPIHRVAAARPTSSRFQKYSDHLPERYLSQMTPFSTPLYDARVHVARARSHFKRKLHHLIQIFVRVDKNQNGLIPRTEVRWCCVLTCTPRRAAAVPYSRARASVSCARRAHEAQGSSPRGGTLCTRALADRAAMYQCMLHVPCALSHLPMCPWRPRRCLAGASILLPMSEVEEMLNKASAIDGEVYWRAITQRLGAIEFNANDGLDRVELALIAGEFASSFDADGDGMTTVAEIVRELRARVGPGLSGGAWPEALRGLEGSPYSARPRLRPPCPALKSRPPFTPAGGHLRHLRHRRRRLHWTKGAGSRYAHARHSAEDGSQFSLLRGECSQAAPHPPLMGARRSPLSPEPEPEPEP